MRYKRPPEQLRASLLGCFTSIDEQSGNETAANVVDGLFAIARALEQVARALHALGNADAATPMGAIEALGLVMKEGFDRIGGSLEYLKNGEE